MVLLERHLQHPAVARYLFRNLFDIIFLRYNKRGGVGVE